MSLRVTGVCRCLLLPARPARLHAGVAHPASTEDSTQTTKPFASIPQPPRLPLFGHTYLYRGPGPYRIERYHDALRSLYARYGPVVRQQLQGGAQGTVVHVFELPDVRAVLRVAATTPLVPPIQEGSRLYRVARGHAVGLGNMNGSEWSSLRRAVQQMLLQPRQVSSFLPCTDRVAQQLVDTVSTNRGPEGGLRSLYSTLARWFLETSGEILFEKPLGALNGSEKAKDEAQKWIQSNIDIFKYNSILKVASPLFKIFPIRPWRKLVKAEDTFHHIASKHLVCALQEARTLASTGHLDGRFNFLAFLMAREEINYKDLVFFVHSMVSEGLATVPSTIQSAIYCLGNNPEVQEKAYQEVRQAVHPDRPITTETIEEMPYIKAVIKETFRMYPLGTEVSRILPQDMTLGGYHIPAGTVVDLNHSCLLKTEQYFPEPTAFKPERWLRGEDATSNAILLTPFGHGPRMCVGRRISQQAMYTVLARLLLRFKFVNSESNSPYGQVYRTLLFPDREISTRFIDRS